MTDLQVLKNKLDELRQLSGGKAGSYKPVPEKEIHHFEQKYGVILPHEYRNYLLEVGYDGYLSPLKESLERSYNNWSLGDSIPENMAEILQKPFSFRPSWELPPFDGDDVLQLKYHYDQCYGGWLSILNTHVESSYILVLNGEEYGNVWLETIGGGGQIFPVIEIDGMVATFLTALHERGNHSHPHVDFYKWYESFLDSRMISRKGNLQARKVSNTSLIQDQHSPYYTDKETE